MQIEILSGAVNPLPGEGNQVVVMARRNGRIRLGVVRDGVESPLVELGAGDTSEAGGTWRIVEVLPSEPAPTERRVGGSKLAATIEQVAQ